ncbi:MAG: histidine phosphotransferase family protein [Paracoccaceae bacterium]|nr:histidine phosphotransferase family protein [Paracoccaceae bacterium]MDG2260400.1 histidine phosphotransferase family protein [Paracoccaceae bacterium]
MRNDKPNLPALLGARICHDLISPVSAISNGMELLHLSGDLSGPEAELIDESAQNACARLKYFRLAFGQVGPDQWISGLEMTDIATRHFSTDSFRVQMDVPNEMSRLNAQMTLLLLLCCETLLSQRGTVSVRGAGNIECQGTLNTQRQNLWTALLKNTDWPADLAASDVHFALAREALNTSGLQLRSKQQDQVLTLTIEPVMTGLQLNREPSRPQRQGT